jgi:riboflavin kinase/FMN adenylyltransferase
MRVFHGIAGVRPFRKAVVALGVFDGVHRGHLVVLKSAVRTAHSIKGESVVLTFDPHPQKESSLYSLDHRLRLFEDLGVDACIVMGFTKSFSSMPAEEFIKRILRDKIGASYVYVGENFRFGKLAEGDPKTLKDNAKSCGYKLKSFRVLKHNGSPISSTHIRRLIRAGDLKKAARLLGRPVSILGSVARGDYLGRKIGFPTANINPHHEVVPAPGIYAVKVALEGKTFAGVCYIGARPTVDTQKLMRIEVHIFGFKRNIYGKSLEIKFIRKLREDRKFPNLALLTRQIKSDVLTARKALSLH